MGNGKVQTDTPKKGQIVSNFWENVGKKEFASFKGPKFEQIHE